ncbi:tetratricopeptide repeat protein [Polaribacter ponticola]|uniref:Tetratricopeptide repeat protein n=1 Tax=Polaribacter ponticola TaxID=2978475 RepID=A0ABT5SBF5_9FLAO|nr:tetratricopeptide repeat protein [Polaribacter sp. MSW5]MDD7915410.1 tetratricopeptide repeat protein [Polaribacter sp. MSW5]
MEDLEFDKNLKKAITATERKQQKMFLNSVEKTIEKPKKTNWLIAASIAAIIGLSSYFIFNNQVVSNQELYAKNFTPYENVVVPIVRNNKELTTKALAFAYYELGEYEKAIDLFNQLTSANTTEKITINFYKANAYLMLDNYTDAKELLLPIVKNNKKVWQQESIWYLALTYIKLEDIDNAKLFLQKLQQLKSYKINKVNDLLKSLD